MLKRNLPTGTVVTVRTTNGGECTGPLLEEYRPTYSILVGREDGKYLSLPSWRIASVEVIETGERHE